MRRFLNFFSPSRNSFALFIYVFVLMFGTYNMSGVSAYHWFYYNADGFLANWPAYLTALFLLIGLWVMFLHAAFANLSWLAIVGIVVVAGIAGYIPFFYGWMDVHNFKSVVTVVQIGAALVISFASSWGRIKFRMFRQYATDSVHGDGIEVENLHDHDDDDHH